MARSDFNKTFRRSRPDRKRELAEALVEPISRLLGGAEIASFKVNPDGYPVHVLVNDSELCLSRWRDSNNGTGTGGSMLTEIWNALPANEQERLGALHPELQALVQKARLPDLASHYFDSIPSIWSFGDTGITWAIDKLIPHGQVTEIFGSAGSGKSTLAQAMAHTVSTACGHFAGRRTTQQQAIYVDLENPLAVVQKRIRQLGIEESRMFRIRGGWDWAHPLDIGEFALIESWMRTTGAKPFIVVDSAARFVTGSDSKDEVVKPLFDALDKIKYLGGTVVLLHNDGKGDTYRGSSLFAQAPDNIYRIKNTSATIDKLVSIVLHADTKLRAGGDLIIPLRYDDGGIGFIPDGKPAAARQKRTEDPTEQLDTVLRDNPSINGSRFEKLALELGIARNLARAYLAAGIPRGRIQTANGPKNSTLYTLVEGAE